MTNIVFFLFWRFSSPRIQELASRSPSQTLEDGKKNYTCSTTHRALPTFRRSPPQQLKKNCGKNVISAVRFFSRLSSSNFLNLLRLQPGLFFFLSSSFFSTFYLSPFTVQFYTQTDSKNRSVKLRSEDVYAIPKFKNHDGMLINIYSSKWTCLMVDILRAARQGGKYPPLVTDLKVNGCLSI